MRVLRHTRFPNGHVEYEALTEEDMASPTRQAVLALLVGMTTEVTLTSEKGTITTYTEVNDEKGDN